MRISLHLLLQQHYFLILNHFLLYQILEYSRSLSCWFWPAFLIFHNLRFRWFLSSMFFWFMWARWRNNLFNFLHMRTLDFERVNTKMTCFERICWVISVIKRKCFKIVYKHGRISTQTLSLEVEWRGLWRLVSRWLLSIMTLSWVRAVRCH